MAFEDLYNGTERIELGQGYWIDIKQCLSHEEAGGAEKYLHKVRAVVGEDGKTQTVVNPDLGGNRFERVCQSIVDWNLDEADGSTWALRPDSAKRRNVQRLPEKVFKAVLARVDELNADDPRDRRDFRSATVGSAEDGDTWATDTAEVLDGAEAVGALGDPGPTVG